MKKSGTMTVGRFPQYRTFSRVVIDKKVFLLDVSGRVYMLSQTCRRKNPLLTILSEISSKKSKFQKKERGKSRECHNPQPFPPQEEEETDKSKQAQIEQTYKKH